MSDAKQVRWMVTFYHSDGGAHNEPDFPKVDFWHLSKEASMKAGARVLQELKDRGDQRDWKAAGHPDPFYANTIYYPGGPWLLPPPPPKLFDPDTIPRMSVTDEEWEAFDRALQDSRGGGEP